MTAYREPYVLYADPRDVEMVDEKNEALLTLLSRHSSPEEKVEAYFFLFPERGQEK